MSVEMITALLAGGGLIVTIFGIVFTSGKMTERLNEHGVRLDGHEETLKAHATTLNEHEVSLGRLQEWKDGYNAAVRTAGKGQVQ